MYCTYSVPLNIYLNTRVVNPYKSRIDDFLIYRLKFFHIIMWFYELATFFRYQGGD